jgi:hypothetical protein
MESVLLLLSLLTVYCFGVHGVVSGIMLVFFDRVTKVSSTNLNQHVGLCAACSSDFFSRSSMKKFTITGESGEPLLLRLFVCRTVQQSKNMWMSARV